MKRLLLAAVAVAAIGFTTTSAQAGGWGGHHHHHRNFRPPVACGPYAYRPPVVAYRPPVVVYRQPVVYQPSVYYPPQNSFFYQGRNFGMQFGW